MLKRHSITTKSFIPFDVALSKKYFFSKFWNFAGVLEASFQFILEAKKGPNIGTNSGPVFVSILSFLYIRVIKIQKNTPQVGLVLGSVVELILAPRLAQFLIPIWGKKMFFFQINWIFYWENCGFLLCGSVGCLAESAGWISLTGNLGWISWADWAGRTGCDDCAWLDELNDWASWLDWARLGLLVKNFVISLCIIECFFGEVFAVRSLKIFNQQKCCKAKAMKSISE